MSELSPIGTLNSDFNVKPASVGPLVSSTHGKVVDENGNTLGPNEPGELCIKGPQVMMVSSLLLFSMFDFIWQKLIFCCLHRDI